MSHHAGLFQHAFCSSAEWAYLIVKRVLKASSLSVSYWMRKALLWQKATERYFGIGKRRWRWIITLSLPHPCNPHAYPLSGGLCWIQICMEAPHMPVLPVFIKALQVYNGNEYKKLNSWFHQTMGDHSIFFYPEFWCSTRNMTYAIDCSICGCVL